MKQTKHIISLLVASCSLSIAMAQHPEPQLVKDIIPGSESGLGGNEGKVSNNKIFFAGYTNDSKSEPWITDGTEAGTTMLKNIGYSFGLFPLDFDSYPSEFTALGFKTLFVATYSNESITDRELFITDGTTAGTNRLKNINATYFDAVSNAKLLRNIGDRVIFVANDGIHGSELWVTDGTTAGTFMLKDIYTGAPESAISQFYVINDKAYFCANDATGSSLWVTDGSVAGTYKIKSNIYCQGFLPFDGKIFMAASTSALGEDWELWTTDGTSAGTLLFKDINPGLASSFPTQFCELNGKIFFSANDGTHGYELWSSDGTVAGTQIVKDIFPGTGNAEPEELIPYDGKLFFSAQSNSSNIELWVSDGTAIGTYQYADMMSTESSNPTLFVEYNNRLYFIAQSEGSSYQYWCVEGANNPPFVVMPADADMGPSAIYEGHFYVEMNGSLYYSAMYKSDIGWELYKITTTPYEPTSIKNIDMAATVSLYPNPFRDEFTLTAEQAITTISIVDVSGKTVWQHTNSNKAKTFSINTHDWMNGIYFVKISTQDNSTITKTIVKY